MSERKKSQRLTANRQIWDALCVMGISVSSFHRFALFIGFFSSLVLTYSNQCYLISRTFLETTHCCHSNVLLLYVFYVLASLSPLFLSHFNHIHRFIHTANHIHLLTMPERKCSAFKFEQCQKGKIFLFCNLNGWW